MKLVYPVNMFSAARFLHVLTLGAILTGRICPVRNLVTLLVIGCLKANPCSHPIIFMRDVEAHQIIALMEFMYAGEVNVAQGHLSTFLKTAESLKIRGLTDTSPEAVSHKDEDTCLNSRSSNCSPVSVNNKHKLEKLLISSSSTVTSSQDVTNVNIPNISSPPPKRQCKSESELPKLRTDDAIVNSFAISDNINQLDLTKDTLQPKVELPDYLSDVDDDVREDNFDALPNLCPRSDVTELSDSDCSNNKNHKDNHYDTTHKYYPARLSRADNTASTIMSIPPKQLNLGIGKLGENPPNIMQRIQKFKTIMNIQIKIAELVGTLGMTRSI
ncbi:hypothetical protein NQ315_012850 [Exocentrus adspersus]|uniref:BTB domain-containing protein n=1 Tax=Exocentrus adspersus TaxID=1586481 RepID=A0AAV8V6X8_9CUCU|nr:hypothetical protein NQ315_012850 [Exocentrus adspersus]